MDRCYGPSSLIRYIYMCLLLQVQLKTYQRSHTNEQNMALFKRASSSLFVFYLIFGAVLGLHGHGSVLPQFSKEEAKKLYIVYLGERQFEDAHLVTRSHHDMLSSVLGSEEAAADSIVYSYKHGFSGFSAMLTESHARKIRAGISWACHTTNQMDYSLKPKWGMVLSLASLTQRWLLLLVGMKFGAAEMFAWDGCCSWGRRLGLLEMGSGGSYLWRWMQGGVRRRLLAVERRRLLEQLVYE
ncbi:hypothetical protein PR202_gb16024 [Eleusine coracana subsp. coracana]|uniref:Inhibitor I9 domain-containing protein n=1 Tax=Eleusine coracana subsp. coracana TaxID=191504 RepID=A0AAV5EZF2_ELECO|nr:hypothetical protein PR202_gb16024 [Eleusine coracana subsp. coracana]